MSRRRLHHSTLWAAGLTLALLAARPAVAADVREEFHQTYPLKEGGRLSISNVNGDVKIAGWERAEVQVDAVKTADSQETMNELTIQVDARPDYVRIETKYPRSEGVWGRHRHSNVEYTISMPRGAHLDKASLVNGNLTIEKADGAVRAGTVNGRVSASGLGGDVIVDTVNGRIEAGVRKLTAAQRVSLESVNGEVRLVLPATAGARVRVETVNGSIRNDFGLQKTKGTFVGQELEGQIGSGGASIEIETVNGNITISKEGTV